MFQLSRRLTCCPCLLLQLAPGGHLGRFIVWTKSAFEQLDSVFGTQTEVQTPSLCTAGTILSALPSPTCPTSVQRRSLLVHSTRPVQRAWLKQASSATSTPRVSSAQESAQKKGYKLPRPLLTNSDLTRLINSDEIQSIVNAPKVHFPANHTAISPIKPCCLVGTYTA